VRSATQGPPESRRAASLSGAALPQQTAESVRDHAQAAFDALGAMEDKQRASK